MGRQEIVGLVGKKILYLVIEDWCFISNRLVLVNSVKKTGYEVSVLTRVEYGADTITRRNQANSN